MTNKNVLVGLIVVAIIAIGGYVFPKVSDQSFGRASGQVHYQSETFMQGLTAGVRDQFTISSAGRVTTGKTLNVTTSNTATSTIIGGCFQFYATSTATAMKFQASTTPGVMYSQYGGCPNL